ncbi:MAG: C4-dicarboxylate ABC transporter, partial [Ideonella sp.]
IKAVTTPEIYKGSIAFIVLQLIMVAVVIAFPSLVSGNLVEGVKVDADAAFEQMNMQPAEESPMPAFPEPAASASEAPNDDVKALLDAVGNDKK